MTTPSAAKRGNEESEDADRDTVEVDAGDLTRLRELDPDCTEGHDRDTVEISPEQAAELARRSGPHAPAAPHQSGESPKVVPSEQKRGSEVEAEASDRAALHTIPAPPPFDDEH